MPNASAHESEWQTRKLRVDRRLKEWGWSIVPFDSSVGANTLTRHAVIEYPTANGPADYALFVGGQLLSILEAKKLSLGPQNVLTQAERYAHGISDSLFNYKGLRVPFLFSTNGEVIWFHDVRHDQSRSRQIKDFFTPSAIEEMLGRDLNAACGALATTPNSHTRLRPYQRDANAAVEKAIADRKRTMMVAMATGTGKTFTLVNQVYRLMKSGAAKRVLFLVDRRALAAQAVRAFASFEPEIGLKFDKIYEVYSQRFKREDFEESDAFDPKVLPNEYLTNPKAKHAFVYVCTVQRMAINLFGREAMFSAADDTPEDDASQLDIPIHAFDCVIADECHRGYTSREVSTWRNTLDYFDAVRIGLTATPAAHTTAYFKDIVFRYEYRQAVRDGHLVDFDLIKVNSNIRMSGLFLKEGEQVGVVDPRSGAEKMDLLEDEREFEATELERQITSPDSNRKMIEEFKKYALEHEQRYGRFPKTLIFAVNDLPHTSHADQIVNVCRDVFGRGDAFVQKITGRVDRPLQRIREFRNRQLPGIVVTVDMLSTGVDIPDLEFIIFLRMVKSRILFEQMLGRGTRKGERFPDKSHFTVVDCFDGTLVQYFKNAVAITAELPEAESRTVQEVIDDIWNNRDWQYNVGCLVKRLHRIDKEMSADGREQFAAFIPEGDMARFATALPVALKNDFTATMKTLRDPAFQDLLINYKRPDRRFLKAYEAVDTVSSEWLIRDGVGNEYRPKDYLALFAKFVKDNPAQVEAIRILLDRPQDWSTAALAELRLKLSSTQEHFTFDLLEKAHKIHYRKALVDIISMVKRAAKADAALLTAAERVERAIQKVATGKTLSDDQVKWLERIRAHLIENLSIERDDFESLPVFAREGGWGRANKVFDDRLSEIVQSLNKEIAA